MNFFSNRISGKFARVGYNDGNDISNKFANPYDYSIDPIEHDAYYDGWIDGRIAYYKSKGFSVGEAGDKAYDDIYG